MRIVHTHTSLKTAQPSGGAAMQWRTWKPAKVIALAPLQRAKRCSPGLRKRLPNRLEIPSKQGGLLLPSVNENNHNFPIPLPLTIELGTQFFIFAIVMKSIGPKIHRPYTDPSWSMDLSANQISKIWNNKNCSTRSNFKIHNWKKRPISYFLRRQGDFSSFGLCLAQWT